MIMKNKKLTVNSIAGKNLIKRKGQYTLLILGIILSMVFSSSVLFFLSCMKTSMEEIQNNTVGAQDGCYVDASEALLQQAVQEGVVSDYSFAYVIGSVYSEQSRDNKISVARLDEKTKNISYLTFVEGAYPKQENEIALEKAAYMSLCPDAEIGDTITIHMLIQNGMEFLAEPVEKSYTLVGIAENKKSNLAASNDCLNLIPSAFVSDDTVAEAGGKELLISYITENNNNENGNFKTFFTYLVNDKTAFEYDNYVMAYFTNQSGDETDSLKTDIIFAVILAVVLLAASCMGIVNAFNSNLKERKKQIGMLRTVGATKRQIIHIFGREAFIISLISAPVSIILSYALVYGISKLMGDSFIFIPDWRVLIGCAVFGIICVMCAALIPLVSAAKISPVQSVRNIEYARKMRKKKIVSKKQFSPSALIAHREMLFSRKTNTAVIVILVLTIFVSCYGFSSYKTEKADVEDYMSYNYDYTLKVPPGNVIAGVNILEYEGGFTNNDLQKALASPYVKSAFGAQRCNAFMLFDEFTPYLKTLYACNSANYYDSETSEFIYLNQNEIDSYLANDYEKQYGPVMQKYGYSEMLYETGIEAYSPEIIAKLNDSVVDGRIDINKLNSGEEIILFAPTEFAFYFTNQSDSGYGMAPRIDDKINKKKTQFMQAERDIKAGDKIKLSVIWGSDVDETFELKGDYSRKDREVTVGAILSEEPENFMDEIYFGIGNQLKAVTTVSGMRHFSEYEKFRNINISLKTDCDEETELYMNEFLSTITSNVKDSYIESDFASAQANRKYYNTVLFSMISIIILFLSISASIINNSMSSKIRESKRKIGTMRAVGASVNIIMNAYMRQLLTTFTISFASGFGLFGIFMLIAFIVTKVKDSTAAIYLDIHIWQTVLACAVLFGVCSINLWLKIHKEIKNSIIDNIREL